MIGYSLERVSLNARRVMFRERTVLGSLGCPSVDYPRVIDLVRQGLLRVSEMVTYRSLLTRSMRLWGSCSDFAGLHAAELGRGI